MAWCARAMVESVACTAIVFSISKVKFSGSGEVKRSQQHWTETSERLKTGLTVQLLEDLDKEMAMKWSLVVTKLEGKDRVISRQAYSELVDNLMGPSFNKGETVCMSTVKSMSLNFDPLPWDEDAHPLLSFLTLLADRTKQQYHRHFYISRFLGFGYREMEAAVTEASNPSNSLANFGAQSVCQVAGVVATCLLFKRLWPLPLPPPLVPMASNGSYGLVPSLFKGWVSRGLMSTFVVVPLCLLVHDTAPYVSDYIAQTLVRRMKAKQEEDTTTSPRAPNESLSLYFLGLPPVWPGATRDDPFTKERIAMGVGQGLLNEIAFRFLLFRSMMSYIRYDHCGFLVAIAHISASQLCTRNPEMARLFHGSAYTLSLGLCHMSTGSILYPFLLHCILYSRALMREAMSREDLMWEELSMYPVAVSTANLLLDKLGLERVLRGGGDWWVQRRRKEEAVMKLTQAAMETLVKNGLQEEEKRLIEKEAMALTVALHSALANADTRPITNKPLTWWEAKEAECFSSVELGPEPGFHPEAVAIASRNILSLRHFILALHRERAKKVPKRGLGSREAQVRALVRVALGSRDMQHLDVEAAARHLGQWSRASDEDVMDLLDDHNIFIHNYMMREMLRFQVVHAQLLRLKAQVEELGPQWSEMREKQILHSEVMKLHSWYALALQKASGAYLASKGLTSASTTSLVSARVAESSDFARFHTEWYQQMEKVSDKWLETAHPFRYESEPSSQ